MIPTSSLNAVTTQLGNPGFMASMSGASVLGNCLYYTHRILEPDSDFIFAERLEYLDKNITRLRDRDRFAEGVARSVGIEWSSSKSVRDIFKDATPETFRRARAAVVTQARAELDHRLNLLAEDVRNGVAGVPPASREVPLVNHGFDAGALLYLSNSGVISPETVKGFCGAMVNQLRRNYDILRVISNEAAWFNWLYVPTSLFASASYYFATKAAAVNSPIGWGEILPFSPLLFIGLVAGFYAIMGDIDSHRIHSAFGFSRRRSARKFIGEIQAEQRALLARYETAFNGVLIPDAPLPARAAESDSAGA